MKSLCLRFLAALAVAGFAVVVSAQTIASADLQVRGTTLVVVDTSVATGVGFPVTIQTEYGGLRNDAAPVVAGLVAAAELSGPGLPVPIHLETAPGRKFQLPGLPQQGTYLLSNIRLQLNGQFDQAADQPTVPILVTQLAGAKVTIRQLTPDEIRALGITLDPTHYDILEYSFSFFVNGVEVVIPYPVAIDKRTHETIPIASGNPFQLPPSTILQLPRWSPPSTVPVELETDDDAFPTGQGPVAEGSAASRPSIPAAIILPSSLAVLHQFFSVSLLVNNEAPAGSSVILDGMTATLSTSSGLRIVSYTPPAGFGQPVPVLDSTNGSSFLVAQAQGDVDWVLEGTEPGTHSGTIEIHATYRSPGQPDFPLVGKAPFSINVADARFSINLSHPDVVRQGIDYSAFSFVTNLSGSAQSLRLTTAIPACADLPGPAGPDSSFICRTAATPQFTDLTLQPGEVGTIEYRLTPGITGHVFATAGTVDGDIDASVSLTMGVSDSGIPLSPTTLVMPYYSRYLDQSLIDAQLQLLGLGYSIATAPVGPASAKFPQVVTTDVFQRAVDIARAGERIFIGAIPSAEYSNLFLDLLGNSDPLSEWDTLRRQEKSGRSAGAALARDIEATAVANSSDADQFLSRFASATAYRQEAGPNSQFFAAYVHGSAQTEAHPYEVSVRGLTSGLQMSGLNEEAQWTRSLPFGDLSELDSKDGSQRGALAILGRWSEPLAVLVTPRVDGPFVIDIDLPGEGSTHLIASLTVPAGVSGRTYEVDVDRNPSSVSLAPGGVISAMTTPAEVPPLVVEGATQDLNLDADGHEVSIAFNRPLDRGQDLLPVVSASVSIALPGFAYSSPRSIFAAATQADQRVVHLSFDSTLSSNASYSLALSGILIDSAAQQTTLSQTLPVTIENITPAGILFGQVLRADGSPVAGAEVSLYTGKYVGCGQVTIEELQSNDCNPFSSAPQYDVSRALNGDATFDGSYLFEYVPRDAANGLSGQYRIRATDSVTHASTALDGAVRLTGQLQHLNLVFLGRGSAEGTVRYENGDRVAGARVVAGSTMFSDSRSTVTAGDGTYSVADLPVGPLTFSATDQAGNVAFAAGELESSAQVLTQDISIFRRPSPGVGIVRGVVLRSDTNEPVPGAQVGVYSGGFAIGQSVTDDTGRFEFAQVPAGVVTVLSAEWSISLESAAEDFDLAPDQAIDVTMTLAVHPGEAPVRIDGTVIREDAAHPNDPASYQPVAGALVKIDGGQLITADATGAFSYPSVPQSFSGRRIQAFDPSTGRVGSATLGSLSPDSTNTADIFIPAASYGTGTIRVTLDDAEGNRVTSGYRIIEPGFPPTSLAETTPGVWELDAVPVGRTFDIWAVPLSGGSFGDQVAHGSVAVLFNGHQAALTLRLPGQGLVRVKLRSDIDLIGDVTISYGQWDEAEQSLVVHDREPAVSTSQNGIAGFAEFSAVPANSNFTVTSTQPPFGTASKSSTLAFDGDVATLTLQLSSLSTLSGTVYAIDGVTPIPGAAVSLNDGRQNQGTTITAADGSFEFTNVAPGASCTLIASITQDGVFRTGYTTTTTASFGGTIAGLRIVMKRQGTVEGHVVYAAYKVFDPLNPANNVPDPTPDDPSDNAPVPLARLTVRELDFPSRTFGLSGLVNADAHGRFTISNVFEGPVRADGADPSNSDLTGTWVGSINTEGETLVAYVAVGAGGVGSAQVTVRDPNNSGDPVANAEVTLFRGNAIYDDSTTDGAGSVVFQQLPPGPYVANAYSKALARSGTSISFDVTRDATAAADVFLLFSGAVDGELTDPSNGNGGVSGTNVTLSATNYQAVATSDATGDFHFGGVREGTFQLFARDPLSNRIANATATLSQENPDPFITLQLEPIDSLFVETYLPADDGSSSGVLAGAVEADLSQRCFLGVCDYHRTLQGSSVRFDDVLVDADYLLTIEELGAAARIVTVGGRLPHGSAGDPIRVVLPAFGSIEVHVTQNGVASAGARVSVACGSRASAVVTDSSGVAVATQMPLGGCSLFASSLDGHFSGSTSAAISLQSVPAVATIALGDFMSITGHVVAEVGGPSVGTPVTLTVGATTLATRTDADGAFAFHGVPIAPGGSLVSLLFIGPDDVTVGGTINTTIIENAERTFDVGSVTLDATPPQLLSFYPSDGAQNVPPDASFRFVFSEVIDPTQINGSSFRVFPADGGADVPGQLYWATASDGTFIVTMTPNPATPFPLKSNTLYRIIVSGAIRDLTGHPLTSTRGGTFVTSDFAAPTILKVSPSPSLPLAAATTFEIELSEPIDPAPFASGSSGSVILEKIDQPGLSGVIVGMVSGRWFLDPTDVSLFFAPDDQLEPSSFYRLIISGVRDLQGNSLNPQSIDFFSYDTTPPFLTLVSPVPPNVALVSGVRYVLETDIRDGDGSGPPSVDVGRVDFYRTDGGSDVFLSSVTKAPFADAIVAPETQSAGTFAIKAVATDLSGNQSNPAAISWTLAPNEPPQGVTVSVTNPAPIYAGHSISVSVSFADEGLTVSSQATMSGQRSDGSTFTTNATTSVTRPDFFSAWSPAVFELALPHDAAEGAQVTIVASVTDVRGQSSSGSTNFVIAQDLLPPSFASISPAAETTFRKGNTLALEAVVSDAESGVASVTFVVDGKSFEVGASSAIAGSGPGSSIFRSSLVVPPENVDTRISISTTARDYHGNEISDEREVIYTGLNDPASPKVAWDSPLDQAVLPADTALTLHLRAHATDEDLTGVTFVVPGIADPVRAEQLGSSDDYEAIVSVPAQPAGTQMILRALGSDTVPAHQVELPIAIGFVAIDTTVDHRVQAVLPSDVATYAGKSILVTGDDAKLVLHAAISPKNLILLDGAQVTTVGTTVTAAPPATRDGRVDLTISGSLYIDVSSSIDVTAQGYLGGWATDLDGAVNQSSSGMTADRATSGGAAPGASATHGGTGAGAGTNTVYDSIDTPTEMGAGGGGSATCCVAGAAGGGSVSLSGPELVIAGSISASGGSGVGVEGAGAGGTISILGQTIVTGPASRISANGGDDDAADGNARGGGGGRVAILATERLDLDDLRPVAQARGGRNATSQEERSLIDAGPGTIFVKRPAEARGELLVSSFDERDPASTHLALPIFAGFVGEGISTAAAPHLLTDSSRRFPPLAIGEQLFVNGDSSHQFGVVGISSDEHSLLLDPSDGDLGSVAGSQAVAYSGLFAFDQMTAGPRALLVLDEPLSVGNSIDDRAQVSVDPSAVLLLENDVPVLMVTSPAVTTIVRGSIVRTTYDAAVPDGLADVRSSLASSVFADNAYSSAPLQDSDFVDLEIPTNTAVGPATLTTTVIDRAGRTKALSESVDVIDNEPPVIDRFDIDPAVSAIYPGAFFSVTVGAHDDVALSRLTISASAGTQVFFSQSLTNLGPLFPERAFVVGVPVATTAPQTITIQVTVEDGFPGHDPVVATRTLALLLDNDPPSLTVTAPAAGSTFVVGAGDIEIDETAVDSGVGVSSVVASLEGDAPLEMYCGSASCVAFIPVPAISGTDPVTRALVVTAIDLLGHSTSLTRMITIQPGSSDQGAPQVSWICGTGGALVPSGSNMTLRVNAVAGSGGTPSDIESVDFFIGDLPDPVHATFDGSTWSAVCPIPSLDDGTPLSIRVVVTNLLEKTASSEIDVTVVTGDMISADELIADGDTTFDGHTLIVAAGTTTIGGAHSFRRLIVEDGAVVTGVAMGQTPDRLDITATDGIYVSCGGALDVTGKGFAGSTDDRGITWPGVPDQSRFAEGAGGNHGGVGGRMLQQPPWPTYDSVRQPVEPGGAGANPTDCDECNAGGGVLHLTTPLLVSDGVIGADGIGDQGAGAGGSIWIEASDLRLRGAVHADGAGSSNAGGGGGRIAIYCDSCTYDTSAISAAGGEGFLRSDDDSGGAGTIFIKRSSESLGDLIVRDGIGATGLPSVGIVPLDSVSENVVSASTAIFAAPDALAGAEAFFDYDITTADPITANDAHSLSLQTPPPPTVTAGAILRGLQRFASITVDNAVLFSDDLLFVGQLEKDTWTLNPSPPAVDVSKVRVIGGPVLHGDAGAIVDPDQPITAIARDARSMQEFSGAVRADGSFDIALTGQAGDEIRLRAIDSNPYIPLESLEVPAGALPSVSTAESRLPTTDWAVPVDFQANRVVIEGNRLVVTSVGTTPTLVVFDISNPSAPILLRTIPVSSGQSGPMVDLALRGSVAWVATSCGLYGVDLESGIYAPTLAGCEGGNLQGLESVAVDQYNIYTASSPFFEELSIFQPNGLSFVQLGAAGGFRTAFGPIYPLTGYRLLGGGSLFDTSNPLQPRLLVSGVTSGNRGVVRGSLFFELTDVGVDVVDISDPAHPSTLGSVTLPAHGSNLDADGSLIVAMGQAGIATVDVSSAAAPSLAGLTATSSPAYDVVAGGAAEYVAAGDALIVLRASLPPRMFGFLIRSSRTGATRQLVGTAGSVTGASPLTVEARNETSGETAMGSVDGSGAFAVDINAAFGDPVTVTASDANGQQTALSLPVENEPPVVSRGRIQIVSATFGVEVVGQANAVRDTDEPIIVIAKDERTGLDFQTTALADGSFSVEVAGQAGDAMSLRARDSNPSFPLESVPAEIGTLPADAQLPGQSPAGAWGVDPSFHLRHVALEGHLLVGWSSGDSSDSFPPAPSNQLAIFDTSAAPAISVRDVVTLPAPVVDVAVQGSKLFVAAGGLYSIDDSVVPAATTQLSPAPCPPEAVTVIGNSLFAVAGGCGAPSIATYDLRRGGVLSNVAPVDLTTARAVVPYAGRFLVVLDGTEVVTIDVGDPSHPVERSHVDLGVQLTAAGVSGQSLIVIGGQQLFNLDISNPDELRVFTSSNPAPHPLRGLDASDYGTFVAAGEDGIQNVVPVFPFAWDVRHDGAFLYVASEDRLTIVPGFAGTVIDRQIIANHASAGTDLVNGLPGAITGSAPFALTVTNEMTGVQSAGTAAADGGFSMSIAASPTDIVSITVVDSIGISTTVTVPLPSGTGPIVNPGGVFLDYEFGPITTGGAGAVFDSDDSLLVIARNERTGDEFTAGAAIDGSFFIPVIGLAGDSISVRARERYLSPPRESSPIIVGTLTSSDASVERPETEWNVDSSFRARRIALEGSRLAIASLAGNDPVFGVAPSSDVVVYDVTHPFAPSFKETITFGTGAVRDFLIRSGWLYVATSEGLFSADLSAPTPVPTSLPALPCAPVSLSALGNHLVVATDNCGSSSVGTFDISRPSSPLLVGIFSSSDAAMLVVPINDSILTVIAGKELINYDDSDPTALIERARLTLPGTPTRANFSNGVLYLDVEGYLAEVSMADTFNPQLSLTCDEIFGLRGLDVDLLIVGALGAEGVGIFDDCVVEGRGSVAAAWDVVTTGDATFVAAEDRMTVLPTQLWPRVFDALVVAETDGTTVRLTGLPRSLTGVGPLAVNLSDFPSFDSTSLTVNADGSFSASLLGASGDSISITVVDAFGRQTLATVVVP